MAQNTGGGRPERVRRGFFTGMALMIGLGLAMSLIMFVGARASMVLMLGEASPAAMDEGMAYLRWISVFYVLCFIGSAYVGLYRGMGWVSVPVIGSVLQQTIRVILAYTLAGPMGLAGVALAIGTGWSAIVLYQTILFRTKVRLRKKCRIDLKNRVPFLLKVCYDRGQVGSEAPKRRKDETHGNQNKPHRYHRFGHRRLQRRPENAAAAAP